MKSYFVCSDIHSYFTEFFNSLMEAGFDPLNKDHILVVLGDIFDRGSQPLAVYNFLKTLPKERRILIRGNHEYLLRDLVDRKQALSHDRSNGTLDTLYDIAGINVFWEWGYYKENPIPKPPYDSLEYTTWENKLKVRQKEVEVEIYNNPKLTEILKWIFSDEWLDYWETDNYIFVHSWIPLKKEYVLDKDKLYVEREVDFYKSDWREATPEDFEEATWGCPWKYALQGLNKTNKTIVCGHWHTSDFFNHLTSRQHYSMDKNPIFKSKKYKLIGLDACTAISGKVNILIIDENKL